MNNILLVDITGGRKDLYEGVFVAITTKYKTTGHRSGYRFLKDHIFLKKGDTTPSPLVGESGVFVYKHPSLELYRVYWRRV